MVIFFQQSPLDTKTAIGTGCTWVIGKRRGINGIFQKMTHTSEFLFQISCSCRYVLYLTQSGVSTEIDDDTLLNRSNPVTDLKGGNGMRS